MSDKIASLLGLTAKQQQSIKETVGPIKTVAEFLGEVVEVSRAGDFLTKLSSSLTWWVRAVGESVTEAVPLVKFVATLFCKLGQIRDPDRLAYLAFTTAYQQSIVKALRFVGPPDAESLRKDWKPATDVTLPGEEMNFNKYSLKESLNHKFICEADSLMKKAITAIGYSDGKQRRVISEIHMRFPGTLKSLLTHPTTKERFTPFTDTLRFDNREERVHAAWHDHFEYQRFLFEDKPVFGEEPFSLADIYVETECGSLTHKESSKRYHPQGDGIIDPFDERFGGKRSLIASVMDLIGDHNFRDAIVVQGPAGSGKSAFTLRLCIELVDNGLNPIRIQFRDLALRSTNIEKVLAEAVRFWDEEQRPRKSPQARQEELFLNLTIFDQIIEFRDAIICPWILILDGWDEVSIAAQKGFAIRINEILTQIRNRFLKRGNRPPVRVILTGRPSNIVSDSRFMTSQTHILTIRSLGPEQLKKFVYKLVNLTKDPNMPEQANSQRFEPILTEYSGDFEHLMEAGSRKRKFRYIKHTEIFGLPLLAHLAVKLMVQWPESNLQSVIENPTTLYRLLTNITCEKGGKIGRDVHDSIICERDLRFLLHETAVAMTVFGKNNIPYNELKDRLNELNKELVRNVSYITQDYPITSLMINFFFKGGRTELGAEFLHKSFREFLFAEAIVEALKHFGHKKTENTPQRDSEQYWKDFDPTDARYGFSRRLGMLLAPQWISNEVAIFLEGLIQWEVSRSYGDADEPSIGFGTDPLELDGWERVRDGLADLWDWWGEGVHLRPQPVFRNIEIVDWKSPYVEEIILWSMKQDIEKDEIPAAARSTTMDGHLGDALFRLNVLVHHYVAVARCKKNERSVRSGSKKNVLAPRRYQSVGVRNGVKHIRFKPSGPHPDYLFNYMSRINAAGWHPGRVFPSLLSMQSVDFKSTFLVVSGFLGCNLQGASFNRADMVGSVFLESDLTSANFAQADLDFTGFRNCLKKRVRFGDVDKSKIMFVDNDRIRVGAVNTAKKEK